MAVSIAVTVALVAGCATHDTPAVRPLPTAEDATTAAPTTPTAEPATTDPAAAAPTPATPSSDGDGDADGTGPTATVRAVLDRYDRVVAALHAEPAALLRPGDPLLAEWAAVVPPGAVLADDVRSTVLDRLARGEHIPPVDGALPYVHHVVAAAADGDERIEFDWCGWSPGIVRDVRSGAVVDDGVGATTGTGVVERTGATWALSALDQHTLDVLPPGSPDPCATAGTGS